MTPVRFGILGTGTIAHKFARTMELLDPTEALLLAVGSRTQASADRFAGEFAVPRSYGSQEALLKDPEVDAVYIASPHVAHKEMCLAALRAGKHVLCEKPLTLTGADSREVFASAERAGVFLMEAMWTRFLPTVLRAKEWLVEGRIGTLRYMTAAFGYHEPYRHPLEQLYDPQRAGGALYDVGIYGIAAALDFFAPAAVNRVTALADFSPEEVDTVNAFLLGFEGGGIASLSSAISCDTDNSGTLYGTAGRIRLYPDFYAPEHAELILGGKTADRLDIRLESGFEYEIRHLCACVREGLTASPRHSPADSIRCGELMEAIRRDLHLI